MAQRRPRRPRSKFDEEQRSGIRAMADGVCSKPGCPQDGVVLKNQRITRYKHGWAHVTCMSGWDDE